MHIFRLMLRCIIISIMCNIEVGNLEQLLKQNERMFSAARLIRRYSIVLTLMVALFAFMAPQPEAKAMDPVTIAILAPVALQAANAARPYVVRGMINFGKGLLKIGKATLEVFFIPYGLFKMIFLSPWGEFRSGLIYTIRGGIGIGKIVFHALLLPVYLFGVEINVA